MWRSLNRNELKRWEIKQLYPDIEQWEPISIAGLVLQETDKAWLVSIREAGTKFGSWWIAKSTVRSYKQDRGEIKIELAAIEAVRRQVYQCGCCGLLFKVGGNAMRCRVCGKVPCPMCAPFHHYYAHKKFTCIDCRKEFEGAILYGCPVCSKGPFCTVCMATHFAFAHPDKKPEEFAQFTGAKK